MSDRSRLTDIEKMCAAIGARQSIPLLGVRYQDNIMVENNLHRVEIMNGDKVELCVLVERPFAGEDWNVLYKAQHHRSQILSEALAAAIATHVSHKGMSIATKDVKI